MVLVSKYGEFDKVMLPAVTNHPHVLLESELFPPFLCLCLKCDSHTQGKCSPVSQPGTVCVLHAQGYSFEVAKAKVHTSQ